jgi:8-oxo-dGTP diphosphatase
MADVRTLPTTGRIHRMTLPSERRFAGVLARHNGEVVLVRERHERWGGEFWNVPSGMVTAHETAAQGAARELTEETGLVVPVRSLRLRTTTSVMIDGDRVHAWNFEVEVEDPALRVQDPDLLAQEARWFAVDEAIERLRLLPYRPLSEPAIATLTGEPAGTTHWAFTSPQADPRVSRSEWPHGCSHGPFESAAQRTIACSTREAVAE